MSEDEQTPVLFLTERKRAFQLVFQSPAGEEVLRDFNRFCRGDRSCVIPGDRDRTLLLEGRREVFLRIQQHLNLTPEELLELYNPTSPQRR